MSRPARIAAVGLSIGVLGGAIAAAAIPDHEASAADPGSGRVAATAPAPAAPVDSRTAAPVRRIAAARPEPTNAGAVLLRVHGTPVVEARATDPAGGPDWAVRVFQADRTYRLNGRLRVIGRNRCAQLGRIHRGRFGWLDGYGTFRPVRASLFASPTRCGSKRPDVGRHPEAQVLRTIGGLGGPTPGLAAAVLWGRLGTAAHDVRARLGGRTTATTSGSDRVVLRVVSPNVDVADAAVSAGYRGATRRSALTASPVRSVLAVRAADPTGALPLGLSAARVRGQWCVGSVGRVVDGRVGTLDYRFGTFTEATGMGFGCSGRARGNPPVPAQMSGGGDLGSDPVYSEGMSQAGRIERRTPAGLTFVAGQVRDDVATVTFRTPHDIRTLLPTGPARAFLVVYDGQFPSGRSGLELGLVGGRTVREPLFLGVY